MYGYCTSFILGGFSEMLVALVAIPFLVKLGKGIGNRE